MSLVDFYAGRLTDEIGALNSSHMGRGTIVPVHLDIVQDRFVVLTLSLMGVLMELGRCYEDPALSLSIRIAEWGDAELRRFLTNRSISRWMMNFAQGLQWITKGHMNMVIG